MSEVGLRDGRFANSREDDPDIAVSERVRVLQSAGGGGHGISLPERANRWAHKRCVENKIRGYGQQPNLV